MTNTFVMTGVHCRACVATITAVLDGLVRVSDAAATLNPLEAVVI